MDPVKNNDIAASKSGRMSGERKIMLGLVAALLIMAAGMYGWKVATVTRWRTDWLRGKPNRPKRMASSSLHHFSQNHLLAALSAVKPTL